MVQIIYQYIHIIVDLIIEFYLYFDDLGTSYWRRVIVRVPEEVSTHESRLAACEKLATYLTTHPTNTYRTAFTVDPDTFDLTPDDEDNRPSLDNYLMDTDIIDHIKRFLEMPANENEWAVVNAPIANHYFSGPVYPEIACNQLGYANTRFLAPAVEEGINQL